MPLTWKNWYTQLKIYMRANNLEDECDQRKVAILLHHIGQDALVIFYSFNVDIDTISFEELASKFSNHFIPQINVTMERHKLFNRRQNLEESIDNYVTDLKNIGRRCNFDSLEDDLIRDIFSWNLHAKNQYIKEKILIQKPETLDQAVQLAKQLETTRKQAKLLEETSFIGQVQSNSSYRRQRQSTSTSHARDLQSSQSRHTSSSRQQSNNQVNRKCGRCLQVHRYKCPALGVKCKSCGKYNHFAVACKNKNVHFVETEGHSPNIDTNNRLHMGTIHVNNVNKESWQINLSINSHNVTFLLDTGADTNILNLKTFHQLGSLLDSISKSRHKLSSNSGEIIPTVGQCTLKVYYNAQSYIHYSFW